MKFIFLMTCIILTTFNSFANEYRIRTRNANCVVKGDVSSIIEEKQKLPNQLQFCVTVKENYLLKSFIEVPLKKEISISDNNIFSLKKADLFNRTKIIEGDGYDQLKLTLNPLNYQKTQNLLIQLGANQSDVEDLYKNIPQLTFKLTNVVPKHKRIQLHYPLNQKDGLSFHIQVSCTLEESWYSTGQTQGCNF